MNEEERQEVEGFIRRGKANARTLTRAHVLLKDAEGWTIKRLADKQALEVEILKKADSLLESMRERNSR